MGIHNGWRSVSSFPPGDILSFLECCAGEWLALRSQFVISGGPQGDDDDAWHSSMRGELKVHYVAPIDDLSPARLSILPPESPARTLAFHRDGRFKSSDRPGTWQLWPDGSLELTLETDSGTVTERICFIKPNLRIRSSVESLGEGCPGRASFSSEIRRVTRPASG